jgi:fructose-bisphosphate aldolase class II
MPLVNLSDVITHAHHHKYAVGAFGVANLNFLEAIMQAAENCRAPVVLNLIESHFSHYDFELLMPAVTTSAKRANVPVAINFDHGTSLASAERAIRAGCNGVMVDTSAMPFSDNLWQTRGIVEMAHACGITVEGELGYVPGIEGENAKIHPGELAYTSATEAKGFVERTGVDCLAVSIGTVHGRMKGIPKLDYVRLAKIKEATDVPLVIHGGTGLSDDQYRKLIANGIAKINYYTGLSDAASWRIRENLTSDRKGDQSVLLSGVRDAVREEVERCLKLWGCGGRAAEVLAQCRLWQEVEHIVLYKTSTALPESDAASILREANKLVEAIPGIRSINNSLSLEVDGKFCFCLRVRLTNKTALEFFKKHPAHMRFSKKVSSLIVVDSTTLDFEENLNLL